MMLEEKGPFGQTFQEWIETVAAFNKNSTGHAADDLLVDLSVRVGMVPEKADMLLWDFYLIHESLAGRDVEEDVVAIVQRGEPETVKVQVRLLK